YRFYIWSFPSAASSMSLISGTKPDCRFTTPQAQLPANVRAAFDISANTFSVTAEPLNGEVYLQFLTDSSFCEVCQLGGGFRILSANDKIITAGEFTYRDPAGKRTTGRIPFRTKEEAIK